MEDRKYSSAFRLSNRQSDSLKARNSLGQLLGAQSVNRMEVYPQEDMKKDVPTTQSTSTLIRRGSGSRSSSKDQAPASSVGWRVPDAGFLMSDFKENLINAQVGLLARLQTENMLSAMNYKNPASRLDKSAEFIYNMFASFNKQAFVHNQMDVVKDESVKHQQAFFAKLEQLQAIQQQAPLAQGLEHRGGYQTTGNHSIDLKIENDNNQNTQGNFQEISSLNSLDENSEINHKPTNHRHSFALNQLDFSPSKAKSEQSLTTKLSDDYKSSSPLADISNTTLQQRIEFHHVKNKISKSSDDETFEGKGSSPPSIRGAYTLDERIQKILNYKKKIIKWRVAHPPNRSFSGRSAVAGNKPRIKGKFVKKDEYQKYMENQKIEATN